MSPPAALECEHAVADSFRVEAPEMKSDAISDIYLRSIPVAGSPRDSETPVRTISISVSVSLFVFLCSSLFAPEAGGRRKVTEISP